PNQIQISLGNSDTFSLKDAAAANPNFVLGPNAAGVVNGMLTITLNTATPTTPALTLKTFQVDLKEGDDQLTFGLTTPGVGSVNLNMSGADEQLTLNTIAPGAGSKVNLTGSGAAIVVNSGTSITTLGGKISLTGQGNSHLPDGIRISGAKLDAGGGSIDL